MNRRMRVLSAILALVALTFSFAEAVVASTCAPMRVMDDLTMMDDVMAVPASSEAAAGSEAAPNPMDCPFMTAHDEREGDREDGRHCPFGPALGQGCAVAPSLPGLMLDVSAAPAQSASPSSLDEVRPHLLLARALFHPPRA